MSKNLNVKLKNQFLKQIHQITTGRYHRHNRMDWNVAQRARRDCFHDASWVEYYTQPRVPEGTVHLIIGDSLLRYYIITTKYFQIHQQTEFELKSFSIVRSNTANLRKIKNKKASLSKKAVVPNATAA